MIKVNDEAKRTQVNHMRLFFWCLSFLKKYAGFFVAFVLFVAIQKMAFTQLPKIIQIFVDAVATGQYELITAKLLGRTILMILIIILSQILASIAQLVYVEKGMVVIQYKAIDKARELGFLYFENTPVNRIMAEVYQNVLSVYFLYERYLPGIMQNGFTFVFAFGMILMSMHVYYIWFTLLSFLCVTFVLLLVSRQLSKKNQLLRDANNRFYKIASDGIEAADEAKGYGATDWMVCRILKAKELVNRFWIDRYSLTLIWDLVVGILQAAVVAGYFLISFSIRHQLSIGNLTALYFYIFMAVESYSALLTLVLEQNRVLTDAEKPYLFMKKKPEIVSTRNCDCPQLRKGDILFQGVEFYYAEENPILKNVDFHIKAGENVVFVGESGSGKTTILKLLLRYYDCIEGKILLDGHLIQDYRLHDLWQAFGIVFQETKLFSGTVLDNIRFAKPDATWEEIEAAAKLAQAHDFILSLPQGYQTLLGVGGEGLSGGQKQRLSITRVLLKSPLIYLLDEITSDLDRITEGQMMDHLLQYAKNATVIAVSHRLSVIQKFEKILVLNNSCIVESGTFHDLYQEGTQFYQIIQKGLVQDDTQLQK